MIIWQGFGFLSLGLIIVSLIAMELIFDSMGLVGESYEGMRLALSSFFAAFLNYLMVRYWFDNQKVINAVDQETGEQIVIKNAHSLFFIPSKFFTYIFILLGIIVLYLVLTGQYNSTSA